MRMPLSAVAARALIPAMILVVAACQQPAPPAPGQAEDTPPSAPTTETRAEVPEIAPQAAQEPDLPKPAEPQPIAVDMEIPADLLDEEADTGFPQTENRYLPDLFAKKKKKAGTTFSGELLMDEEQDLSIDAVTGAKINVEIPVD